MVSTFSEWQTRSEEKMALARCSPLAVQQINKEAMRMKRL
jgi:hypothetical protein